MYWLGTEWSTKGQVWTALPHISLALKHSVTSCSGESKNLQLYYTLFELYSNRGQSQITQFLIPLAVINKPLHSTILYKTFIAHFFSLILIRNIVSFLRMTTSCLHFYNFFNLKVIRIYFSISGHFLLLSRYLFDSCWDFFNINHFI